MENEFKNKITYHQEGEYLIPYIKLPEENPKYKNKTIGKYGTLRLNYLKEYKKGLYQQLLMENKLFEHLVKLQGRNILMNIKKEEMLWIGFVLWIMHRQEQKK